MLSRAFPVDGSIHLNSGRPLEHCLVLRCVAQNCGVKDDDDSSETSTASDLVLTSKAVVIQEAITFPSPETLFAIIWKLIPVYIQQKITDLADENNARAITQEIYSYVKVALGLLPIPVPGIFIDAAVNLVVPPLVAYIVTKLSSSTQDTVSLPPHPSSNAWWVLKRIIVGGGCGESWGRGVRSWVCGDGQNTPDNEEVP